MNPFLNNTLHLSLAELMLFMIGALIVGFAIHFLWVNRKGGEEALKIQLKQKEKESDQWRLKFYDMEEAKEREISALSETIKTLEEKEENQAIEIEELSLLNQQLKLKLKNAQTEQKKEPANFVLNTYEEPINEEAKNFRQELQKLAQKYSVLENELNRLQERM